MSNVSNTHNVQTLDKASKALTGQRMARVIAKKNKEGQYESEHLTESKFVSIPHVGELSTEDIVAMMPHIKGILADAQDGIIRDLIVSDGVTSINDEEISIASCIKYLDEVSKGNRVTGEFLAKWFNDSYLESSVQFVCAMMKFPEPDACTEDQLKAVMAKVNTLSSMFAGFASGKYSPDIPKCKGMLKFGEFLGADVVELDARMGNYLAKAKAIKETKEAELASDALGF